MLVKPVPVSNEELFNGTNEHNSVDLEDHEKDIAHCFSTDDVEECKKRLKSVTAAGTATTAGNASWSVQALEELNKTSPQLASTWFKLTRVAANEPIEFVYRAEERATAAGH